VDQPDRLKPVGSGDRGFAASGYGVEVGDDAGLDRGAPVVVGDGHLGPLAVTEYRQGGSAAVATVERLRACQAQDGVSADDLGLVVKSPGRAEVVGPADRAGVDEPFHLDVRGVEDLVMGCAELHAVGLRGIDKGLALPGIDRERLFHQHVLACLQRSQSQREMKVVRQAYGNRSDARVGDQLSGVRIGGQSLGGERLKKLSGGVRHRRQAGHRRLADGRHVNLAGHCSLVVKSDVSPRPRSRACRDRQRRSGGEVD
jgi:hypothetical protein